MATIINMTNRRRIKVRTPTVKCSFCDNQKEEVFGSSKINNSEFICQDCVSEAIKQIKKANRETK